MQVITVLKPVEPVKPPVEKFVVELTPLEALHLTSALEQSVDALRCDGYQWLPGELERLHKVLDVAVRQK